MEFLQMNHISKQFGNVTANKDVTLSIKKGEIHALLGENGAGKSTLMNILYGMYRQTEGEIYLDGKKLNLSSPQNAISNGIGMVHQHFMLIPAQSVIENVVLGLKDNKTVLDLKSAAAKLKKLAETFHMEINPWEKVSNLSIGEQQRVEILKALFRGARLLILDEPTAVLTPQEAEALFDVLRKLKIEGCTIIFISHKLKEIMAVCDACTVLRKGETIKTIWVKDIVDTRELAELMVGKTVELTIKKEKTEVGKPVLTLQNVSYQNKKKVQVLKDISFQVHEGEILGVCGVDGNGQSELIHCITGIKQASKGIIMINGTDTTREKSRKIMSRGVAHIPEDRQKYGIVQEMSIKENMILMSYLHKPLSRFGFLQSKNIENYTKRICDEFEIKAQNIDEKIMNLSGGNQQKVVVGRELSRNPKLLIAVHPDRGLDIGAAKYIQREIINTKKKGGGVLLVSSELDELMDLTDRIMVIYHGQIIETVSTEKTSLKELGELMMGIKNNVEEKNA